MSAPPDTDAAARALLDASLAGVASFGESLPGLARDLWDAVHGDWTMRLGMDDACDLFLGPRGTPAFQLLAWVAESTGTTLDSEPARAAGEAMLAWYFALRCQDDRVDEDAPADRIYLEQVLLGRALRRMLDAAGDPGPAMAWWEALGTDFAAVAVADQRARTDPDHAWDEDAIAAQGHKYLPMAGAPGALLIRAGRAGELPALRRMVERLGVGLQLTNDLLGVRHDLERGLRSPLVALLDLPPGNHHEGDLLAAVRGVMRSGDLDRYMERIDGALRGGLSDGPALSSTRMREHVDQRLGALQRHHTSETMRAVLAAPPLTVDVELTQRCDLCCPACFVRAQRPAGAGIPELPTALALELLDELASYRAGLHLTGGEPFLHAGIWEVLERAAALQLSPVTINTHGGSLGRDGLARLGQLDLSIHLLVSIDGPPGVHDRHRGAGAAAAALGALRGAPDHGLRASAASLMTAELIADGIDAWLGWLEGELGRAPELVLWPLFLPHGSDELPGGPGHAPDDEALWSAAGQVAAARDRGARIVIADYPLINPLLRRHGVPDEALWQCGAGDRRLAVQADGAVTPCHPLRWPLGRVDTGGVRGFIARARATRDAATLAVRDYDDCAGCEERAICGHCRAVVVARGDPLGANDGRCRDLLRDRG